MRWTVHLGVLLLMLCIGANGVWGVQRCTGVDSDGEIQVTLFAEVTPDPVVSPTGLLTVRVTTDSLLAESFVRVRFTTHAGGDPSFFEVDTPVTFVNGVFEKGDIPVSFPLGAGGYSADASLELEGDAGTVASCDFDVSVVEPSAELTVVKSGPAQAIAGQEFDYSFTVQSASASNSPAVGVGLVDVLPAGVTYVRSSGPACTTSGQTVTCPLDDLQPQASTSFSMTVRAADAGTIQNQARATYSLGTASLESPPSNTVTTTILSPAALDVRKEGPPAAIVGGQIAYRVTVSNPGGVAIEGVTVTDELAAGSTVVSADGCSVQGQSVSCAVAALAPAQEVPFSIVVTRATEGQVCNTATASGGGLSATSNEVCTTVSRSGRIAFSAPSYSMVESGGAARLAVSRDAGIGAASVRYETIEGSARASEDFQGTSGVLRWADGEAGAKTFDVPLIDNAMPDGTREFRVRLSSPTGAELGSPAEAVVKIQDDDQPKDFSIQSGNGQVGTVGQELEDPLVVQVVREDGAPVEGVVVTWKILSGSASLLDPVSAGTDADGSAQNRLRFGDRAGEVVVEARADGFAEPLTFRVTSEFALAETPNLSPTGSAVAAVLDQTCATAEGDLGVICTALATLEPSSVSGALEELSPREAAAQGTASFAAAATQLDNLFRRLAALRGGASGLSLEQLGFVLDGQGVPWQRIAAAVRDQGTSERETGGAAGEDEGREQAPWGIFANGTLGVGKRDQTAFEEGFELHSSGITVGVDYRFSPAFVLGAALGYATSDTDLAANGGSLDSDAWTVSVYGVYSVGDKGYVEGVAGWGQSAFDLTRNIDIPGLAPRRATGDSDGDQLSLGLGVGYDLGRGATGAEIFLRGAYSRASLDSYAESGAAGANLFVFGRDLESLLASGGVNLTRAVSLGWGVLVPTLRLTALHELEDSPGLISARFLDDPLRGVFTVQSEAPDQNYFNVAAGVSAQFRRGISAYLLYSKDLEREDLDFYSVTGGFRWEF